MRYLVERQRIDTENKKITFFLVDEEGKHIELPSGELKQKMRNKEITVINFKLEGDKLKYTNGFFKPRRTLTDQQLPDDKYIVGESGNDHFIYSRDGKEIEASWDDIEYLGRAGRLINTRIVDCVEFDKLKWETPGGYGGKPYLTYDSSIKVTKENFSQIKGIIQIHYKNFVAIKEKWDRMNDKREYMEPRKFWAIIKSFNHGKMDYTAEDIEKYADEIADRIFLYTWFNMIDDEFSKFYTSFDDFEATLYNYICETEEDFSYNDVIQESDDGFRQAMCTLLCLYGEQGCKEFIQDPAAMVKKYNVPLEKFRHCYIYGY